MPTSVYVIWTILLLVIVLALPFIVMALQQTLRAARNIERYFAEMLTAGLGIAQNTGNIAALQDTITVAGGMLSTAGEILNHTDVIKTTLAARAEAINKK